jgi:hypothetical protein
MVRKGLQAGEMRVPITRGLVQRVRLSGGANAP